MMSLSHRPPLTMKPDPCLPSYARPHNEWISRCCDIVIAVACCLDLRKHYLIYSSQTTLCFILVMQTEFD